MPMLNKIDLDNLDDLLNIELKNEKMKNLINHYNIELAGIPNDFKNSRKSASVNKIKLPHQDYLTKFRRITQDLIGNFRKKS